MLDQTQRDIMIDWYQTHMLVDQLQQHIRELTTRLEEMQVAATEGPVADAGQQLAEALALLSRQNAAVEQLQQENAMLRGELATRTVPLPLEFPVGEAIPNATVNTNGQATSTAHAGGWAG